ncbi:bifunctional 2-polyprenyl-6-hydroxyphenol methylase/3-demethylubiquinol 3-O-methyltransferase UbiG [Acidisoma sp. 7E03]
MQQDGTLSENEVARFGALAAEWWDPKGPMAPLHAMNPLRAGWIETRVRARYPSALPGEVLDIGCGAGLLAEALAARGLPVLGLDAAAPAIQTAEAHAAGRGLPLRYRAGRIEDLVAEGASFPVVTALELIEHVPDQAGFLALLAQVTAPGGLLFISTLNRSLRALAIAKIGAEYVARLLPRGTHDWRQFLPPRQLSTLAAAAGLRPMASAGLRFDPWRRRWVESRDLSINYIMAFEKPTAGAEGC